MSGTTKKLQLLGKLQSGVYFLSEGETLADAPIDADVVIDPYSAEAVFPEGGSGGAQSDWNAAEGEPGHVLNRPFYSEYGMKTLLEETTMTATEETEGMAIIPHVVDITGVPEVEVVYNGTKYVCPVTIDDSEGMVTFEFGDRSLMGDDIESTGEPFVAMFFDATSAGVAGVPGVIAALDGSAEFTISIVGNAETAHPIPEKYLPSSVKPFIVDISNVDLSSSQTLMTQPGDEISKILFSGGTVLFKHRTVEGSYETVAFYNVLYFAYVPATKNTHIFITRGTITTGALTPTEIVYTNKTWTPDGM